jgi:uncharacterized protein
VIEIVFMPLTVEQALAQTTFYTDGVDYVIVRLPAGAIMAAAGVVAEIGEPFSALVVDKHEVSLVIPADALKDFAPRLRDHIVSAKTFRLITFDIELEMELVGFMARVSTVLAAAHIPILPLAAYTRDHLLVPSDQVEVAIAALERLKSSL